MKVVPYALFNDMILKDDLNYRSYLHISIKLVTTFKS